MKFKQALKMSKKNIKQKKVDNTGPDPGALSGDYGGKVLPVKKKKNEKR